MSNREIEVRSIGLNYLLLFCTFGLWNLVWLVKTKRDMNALGGDIPTTFLLLVPFANFYYIYKYAQTFSEQIKKDDSTTLWVCVNLFVGIIMPYFVQAELNKIAESGRTKRITRKTNKNITRRTAA